ncbi:MAG: monovalent cation/H(+) antiporter subunit G [Planctomycetota bacterium]
MIVVEVLAWICLVAGSFFSIVGGFGIVRMPEFFSRMHAGGITDTLGAGLVVLGLLFHSDGVLPAIKLLMILFFLLVTSPTACHALAKSALSQGMRPELENDAVKSKATGS